MSDKQDVLKHQIACDAMANRREASEKQTMGDTPLTDEAMFPKNYGPYPNGEGGVTAEECAFEQLVACSRSLERQLASAMKARDELEKEGQRVLHCLNVEKPID